MNLNLALSQPLSGAIPTKCLPLLNLWWLIVEVLVVLGIVDLGTLVVALLPVVVWAALYPMYLVLHLVCG